ncbi:hypothetical protein [Pseudoalteromonas luteoviolacea]|uniref:Uncharacterized protein n=1 Tax=Pseudoalteromonas luteoviolacea S4054 TaxID=1129367 RepID=A0A0F6ABF5_9GAMM|nr:hypothetical protein [Pseudoalteromonas luteoviolacea]AOT08503.1 hypothetical protein S4054249_11885 [Pseudoalteromonas luteoviolacea]AOT13419.1 hypothetical protein S40542_11860 [Pseudoalteromonas luteoviolacea]AOT18332.1 hypothetical protein S4054_11860 [Pseudoalteromonas luteoviolacea]KKE83500.1 hypothetical protein N479_14105 [Pseudoalteromonas luteoviolacea S4054]KZN75937.1 hypothetical protein N481_06200 [Pseudoalteromonas luteoviolacea S4047-1]
METNALKIASDASLNPGQDLDGLRAQGVAKLQKLAPDTWSDHNVFDPGITLLEVLAYVLSDLSYKLNYSVEDLITVEPGESLAPTQFLNSEQVMFSHCVTLADYRRLFLDIPEIKNITISVRDERSTGATVFDVIALASPDSQISEDSLREIIHSTFAASRCVTHQLGHIEFYKSVPVHLGMHLVLKNAQDLVQVMTDILSKVALEISPNLTRYSAQELLGKGMYVEDIYVGPSLHNGFILDEDLDSTPVKKHLYSSDILDALRVHPNIEQIEEFRFIIEQGAQPGYEYWQVEVQELDPNSVNLAPELGFLSEQFFDAISLVIEGQSYVLDEDEIALIKLAISERIAEQTLELQEQAEQAPLAFLPLSQYRSLQHELPNVYALTEQSLNRDIDSEQKAQLLQFKGYLHLFDQILADQHKQLDVLPHILALPQYTHFERLGQIMDRMLSSEALSQGLLDEFWHRVKALPHTQLSQAVTGISGVNHLVKLALEAYQQQGLQQQLESDFSVAQLTRLNDSIAHLLARFAIKLPNANLLKYREVFGFYINVVGACHNDPSEHEDLLLRLVLLRQYIDKCRLLNEIGSLGENRCRGFDYLSKEPKTAHMASLSRLVMRSLGFSHHGQMPLATHNRESLYLLESDLLGNDSTGNLFCVLPNWTTRLQNTAFRVLVESQIDKLRPLHLSAQCVWLTREQMSLFERLYFGWLNFYGQAQRERFAEGQAHIANVAADIGGLLETLLVSEPDTMIENIINYVLAKPQGMEVLEAYLVQILSEYASEPLPNEIEIDEQSYTQVRSAVTQIINEHSALYPEGFSEDQVLYLATQLCIDHICTPNAFAQSSSTRFTVGYSPLPFLKPILPVSFSQINSNTAVVSKFIVATSVPNRIDPEGNEE